LLWLDIAALINERNARAAGKRLVVGRRASFRDAANAKPWRESARAANHDPG
jgi:hypothetical protein